MTKALLQADYADIARTHTVEVLEDLRDVFIARIEQVNEFIAESEERDMPRFVERFTTMAQTYRVCADDIALAIQRQQRRMHQ